jgi:hypothetical protein
MQGRNSLDRVSVGPLKFEKSNLYKCSSWSCVHDEHHIYHLESGRLTAATFNGSTSTST